MFGGTGNYASALYLAAVKANSLDKAEKELVDFAEALKRSATFSQFISDPTVHKDTKVKVISDVCADAKFSEIMKNFLGITTTHSVKILMFSFFNLRKNGMFK